MLSCACAFLLTFAMSFVADPAAGSGAVENLTEALCEAAWEEFHTIEQEGGILQSLTTGNIQERITTARQERAAAYRDGRRTIVGSL